MSDISYYHCAYIEYDFDSDASEKADKVIKYAIAHARECTVKDSNAGACWNYYIIIEGVDEKEVHRVAELTLKHIKRFKGHQLF